MSESEVIIKVYNNGFVIPIAGAFGTDINIKCDVCDREKKFLPEDLPEKIPFNRPIMFKCSGCQTEWVTRYRFIKQS